MGLGIIIGISISNNNNIFLGNFLLQENGDNLLLENGSNIII
jgi:hypothetical protein